MAKKRNIESASVFERSGIRAIRARAIEVLLYMHSATTAAPNCINDLRVLDLSGDSGQSVLTLQLFQMAILANQI